MFQPLFPPLREVGTARQRAPTHPNAADNYQTL